ncbi:MAG: PilZ domain-containing protein [Terriglobales bacterium]
MDLQILLVCPDQEPASLLTAILSEMGMEVEHTTSTSRGLELLDEQQYDAIVLDYRADPASEEFLGHLCRSFKNRATMLIAVVDAEFNPRPIFGLGANFVLYRPLTSERTRLSLHAARSLMRRERRRSARAHVSSTANVSYPGAPELNATIVDISNGGTLITTRDGLPNARKVYFEFALPGQKQLVRLSGEVAWQDFSGRSGIKFLDVPQASRRLIQTWLEHNGSEEPTGAVREPELITHESTKHQLITHQPSQDEHPAKTKSASRADLDAGNRRGEERLPCNVGAEVYCAGVSIPNRCSLSDISEGGCYVEMPSPFTGHSPVEIMIRTSDMKFRLKGQVLSSHPGFGMGVRFVFQDSAEREEILKLLAVISAGPTNEPEQGD